MSSPTRKTQVTNVIQVSSGNFLEMYDFMAFGYFASAIGETYFPTGDHFASLMSSLMTFGARQAVWVCDPLCHLSPVTFHFSPITVQDGASPYQASPTHSLPITSVLL